MADSTTLMTFLVRAPQNTRSVALLGSWDNFAKPYAMKRDGRVGSDHWTGCFSFENIICDGSGSLAVTARDGGLRMGGTYWYFYKLDDDIEFHNSAESATTSCPMLPGQLINVLHVPFHLSGARSRNASVSSTSSIHRTMNPADKYLNPRPVPQPKLPRLNTSPGPRIDPMSAISASSTISPWSGLSPVTNHSVSQPSSATGLKKFRLPRKASMDSTSRSVSPSSRIGGLRAKFGSFKAPREKSPEADLVRGRLAEPEREISISSPIIQHWTDTTHISRSSSRTASPAGSRQVSPQAIAELEASGVPTSYFALRRSLDTPTDADESFTAPSFQQHRRQRSRSRDPSGLRRSLSLSEEESTDLPLNITTLYQPLETVREVASNQNTPTWPVTAFRLPGESATSPLKAEMLMEKRLPTLPNTPSSVYPPSIYSDSPANRLSEKLQALQSHFSDSTMASTPYSRVTQEPSASHFSTWTNSTGTSSIASDYARVQSECDEGNLHQTWTSSLSILGSPFENKSADTIIPAERAFSEPEPLASTTSCSTISSTFSTSPTSPQSENFYFEAPSSKIAASAGTRQQMVPAKVHTYRLPDHSPDEKSPMTCIKTTRREAFPSCGLDFLSPSKSEFEMPTIGFHDEQANEHLQPSFPHSESMQQLMAELSYLGDMIQN